MLTTAGTYVNDPLTQPPSPSALELLRLPKAPAFPLIGHALGMTRDPFGCLQGKYREMGPVFRMRLLNRRFVVLAGLDATELLARESEQLFRSKGALGAVRADGQRLRVPDHIDSPAHTVQLAHTVEAAAIRAAGEGAVQIEVRHLFREPSRVAADDRPPTVHEQTRRFQATLVRETLEQCDLNVTEAARRFGPRTDACLRPHQSIRIGTALT